MINSDFKYLTPIWLESDKRYRNQEYSVAIRDRNFDSFVGEEYTQGGLVNINQHYGPSDYIEFISKTKVTWKRETYSL